jgi:hypothetical protein
VPGHRGTDENENADQLGPKQASRIPKRVSKKATGDWTRDHTKTLRVHSRTQAREGFSPETSRTISIK